jgi:hypothetical protein
MKRLIFFCLFLFTLFLLPSSFKRFTCGFKIAKMELNAPYRADWEVPQDISSDEASKLLSQEFIYLDRGAQCYVFASRDGLYVVKIFRFDSSLVNTLMQRPLKKEKVESLFRASVLAFEKAREETGVLFLHLNRSENLFPLFKAKGPLGQKIRLNLDHFRFVIQKRVEPFRASLLKEIRSSNREGVKRKIDSFLFLVESRVDKGIRNSDPSLSRNFGFLGDRALEIDFGNYSEHGLIKENEIGRYTRKLREWLTENAPEWIEYLDERTQYGRRLSSLNL